MMQSLALLCLLAGPAALAADGPEPEPALDAEAPAPETTPGPTEPDPREVERAKALADSPSPPPLTPERAAYLQRVMATLTAHFAPPVALAQEHPDLRAVYDVTFDPETGDVTGFVQRTSSGEPAHDAAVERCLEAVEAVPVAPEAERDTVGGRLTMIFLPR